MLLDLKQDIYTFLSTAPTITPLVGTRIYPSIAAPGATLPYIVYERINLFDAAPYLSMASPLGRSTYQFSCWGLTSALVEQLTLALWNLLDGFRGVMGASFIQAWRYTDALDGIVSPSEGGIEGTYRTTLTADVWHTTA